MKKVYCLDACAFIAYLDDEVGADVVTDLIQKADDDKIVLLMHKLNFLEVFYHTNRKHGKNKATLIFNAINTYPIELVSDLSDDIFLEAGRLKSKYKLSLADSIGLAYSTKSKACFVTSDKHEIKIIAQNEKLKVLWVR